MPGKFLLRNSKNSLMSKKKVMGSMTTSFRHYLRRGRRASLRGFGGRKVPLWRAISNMKAAQKVRLAILGNASARKILIRDPKKAVSMAVLRSPRLTDKEVSYFATQKSISEDVIRMIAKNREWTRHYSTKVALVKNPKTPPQQSMWFLKSLHLADLKSLARDRDVPGVIMKSAKRMVDQKTAGSKGPLNQSPIGGGGGASWSVSPDTSEDTAAPEPCSSEAVDSADPSISLSLNLLWLRRLL